MKQLWFTTSSFSPRAGEEEKTNPGRFGEELAEWVRDQLRGGGYQIDEPPIPEDWGWIVMVQRKPFSLWIGCGNEDGELSRWGVFVEAQLGIAQKLFKLIDPTGAVLELERALEKCVRDAGFERIEWE